MEEDSEKAKLERKLQDEMAHLFKLPLLRLGELAGVNQGELPDWMLQSRNQDVAKFSVAAISRKESFPAWMSASKDKRVLKFLADLDKVNRLLEDYYAMPDFNRLSEFERMKRFYEIVKERGVVECFVALQFSAKSIIDSGIIARELQQKNPKDYSRTIDFLSNAAAMLVQLFASGGLLYGALIETAKKLNTNDPRIKLFEGLQKNCQEIADEFQNGLAVMEDVPEDPAQLGEKNAQVFGAIKNYLLGSPSPEAKEQLLKNIDDLINRYRQKLQLYVRLDESKIEASIVRGMLSNITVLLYFAKKIDPNYQCESLKGLIFAVNELGIRAEKAAQEAVQRKSDTLSDLATLNSGQAGEGPGAAPVFLEKMDVLFPDAQKRISGSRELEDFRQSVRMSRKELTAMSKEQEARFSTERGSARVVSLADVAGNAELLKQISTNYPRWMERKKKPGKFLDDLSYVTSILGSYQAEQNRLKEYDPKYKTRDLSELERIKVFYDMVLDPTRGYIQRFINLRVSAAELSALSRETKVLKKKFKVGVIGKKREDRKLGLATIISLATTVPKEIFEKSMREYSILIAAARKEGDVEQVRALEALRNKCGQILDQYYAALKAAGIDSPRKEAVAEIPVEPAASAADVGLPPEVQAYAREMHRPPSVAQVVKDAKAAASSDSMGRQSGRRPAPRVPVLPAAPHSERQAHYPQAEFFEPPKSLVTPPLKGTATPKGSPSSVRRPLPPAPPAGGASPATPSTLGRKPSGGHK